MNKPQWSPVMKTGNTSSPSATRRAASESASMEPGHEDREYRNGNEYIEDFRIASMEPGHEDREYSSMMLSWTSRMKGLNGARS